MILWDRKVGNLFKWSSIIFVLFHFGCNNPKDKEDPLDEIKQIEYTVKRFSKNVYFINTGGCVFKDSIIVDSIGNRLYTDKKGNVYFKTWDLGYKWDDPPPVLILRLYNACEGDSTYDLSRNIDVKTFHSIGGSYFKDKNRVIIHNEMLDGGNLGVMEDADVKTFKSLPNSNYAIDKKHVYYQGMPVENVNPKTFKVIYKYQNHDTLGWYGEDGKNYFDGYDICTKKKVEEFLKE
jgi:hypothetical protein